MNIKILGVDLAKNLFHLYGVDERGKELLNKRICRSQLANFIANLSPCLIGMEACGDQIIGQGNLKNMGMMLD